MSASDENKMKRQRRKTTSLEQYLSGGMLFARTVASKVLLRAGNPHLSVQAETVLRFMQQYRDPKSGDVGAGTVPERRLVRLRKMMDRAAPAAPSWVRRQSVTVPSFDAAAPGLAADWLIPPSASGSGEAWSSGCILYLHGGAYLAGSIRSHERMVSFIANASRVPALVLQYSLAPEHRWPTQLREALAAFAWLVDTVGVDPSRVVVMGDSAGGNLSLVSALALAQLNDEASRYRPGGLVLLSPWVNLDVHSDESKRHSTWTPHADTDYLPSNELDATAQFLPPDCPPSLVLDPLVSPAFADDQLLARLPPTLVSMGAAEQLAGQINWFCASVQRAKPGLLVRRSYEGMPHVFHMFGSLMPQARLAIADIGRFVAVDVLGLAVAKL